MKIILLFDSDRLDNRYREYELLDDADEALRKGEWANLTFCHPDHGEVFIAKIANRKDFESKRLR